jgi:signal transduction histidine kinase
MSLKAVTNSDVAFVSGSRVVAASFDPAQAPTLLAVASGHDAFTVPVGGETFIGRVQPLGAADDPDGPLAFVLRSRSERLKFLNRLRWQIAGTGLAAVLGATLASYLVARTVTRPLRALTSTMGEMAATGDLARSLPPLGRWDDEDVRLVATTFHRLTSALDRHQREAAQRERLSSLGRLSAVVAHEIRNPLMIIKAAAHTLRRDPSAPAVAAASQSIDEEVARLNQVVAGVLDFARPIPFVLAEADLNEICRAAARASAAAPDAVAPVFEDPGGAATILTDTERLRAVLVNVLHNAQHAVADRPAAARAAAPIVMRVASTGDGWTVRVTDVGIGIAGDDLPRIFDPFFTARRGGSGLGLAISKNVIEGLGGTIAATSRLGEGTTITITLPARPSGPEARL